MTIVKGSKFKLKAPRANPIHTVMKQKKAIQIWEKNNFKNLPAALEEAGYTAESAKKSVTRTKTWKDLMEEYLPDDLLAKRHKELLNKRNYELVPRYEQDPNNKKKTIKTFEKIDLGPDTTAVAKGLDLAYKVKGTFKETQEPPKKGDTYNLFFDPKVREARRVYEDAIKQKIKNESIKRIKAIPSKTEGSDTPVEAIDNAVDPDSGDQGENGDVGEAGGEE